MKANVDKLVDLSFADCPEGRQKETLLRGELRSLRGGVVEGGEGGGPALQVRGEGPPTSVPLVPCRERGGELQGTKDQRQNYAAPNKERPPFPAPPAR